MSYEEKNITTDKSARTELMQLGARGVPAFLIGNELVVGFDEEKIDRLLNFTVIDCPECKIGLRLPKDKGSLKVTCPKCKAEFKTRT
jgi:glutaredoxin 3